ncbi:amino acid permease [Bacillus paranthracis]|uniref:APC family permease n=1 Tax=Bacillus TaxID=1386 RepID=UPI0022E48822|nr:MULTISPECIES: amino acid permease [Bacillus cereus group]MDA1745553.1 amino acid permease [Bacillus cereus group sp. LD121LC]MDK7420850.1 amino acid permease [Bacillus paranthracis]MDK7431871.1 amino acid permease [Bacillus paranthracis]MDK7517331.1 amino acid permease [Bacillus paranthracis]MDK7573862.1 amino acid permease [Bacillus paranthracis]
MHHDEKNKIGLTVALSIVVGTIIGSGVFMKPGSVLDYSGSSNMAILAWIIGGLLTLASGLTVAEIGAQIPKNGGLYTYLEEIYGSFWGYLSGWMQTIVYGPAIIGTLGLYFSSLMINFFYLDKVWNLPIAIGTVVFLGVVNSMGTKYGGIVQTITTIGKMIPIVLIVVLGFWKGNSDIFNVVVPISENQSIGMAILATLFAYDGWILLASIGGEMKNPTKLLPKAMTVGILIVTAAYVLINLALLNVLPATQIVELGENATATAAGMLLGEYGGKIISIGIIVSIFGCLNGKILTFPRIPMSMAERGQLPFAKFIAKESPRFKTPANAITVEIILGIILMIISDPNKLSEISVFIIYIFYVMTFIGVFALRKRNKNKERAYSVPLFPIVPIVAILGSLFVIGSAIINDPLSCFLSIGIVFTGLPVYWYLNKKNKTAV